MTLNQIIGYRTILLSNGTNSSGSMEEGDFVLFNDWITASLCNGNANRQVFVMDGDQTADVLMNWPSGQSFMTNVLGASLECGSFNGHLYGYGGVQCPPEETAYCVRYLAAPSGVFDAPLDVDAYGNWCPQKYPYDILRTAGTGLGNRYYLADGGGGKQASYAQVVNENLAADANYRTIMTGVSLHHLTARASGPDPCPRDNPSIFGAVVSELGAALRWGFGVGDNAAIPKLTDAKQLATCEGTWSLPTDVEDGSSGGPFVNRLYANAPNPFNPRTTIQYSLASAGPVRIEIYDVDGRHVRTIVDSPGMPAGRHDAIWDGTNDRGARVGSGVYWAQMRAGTFTSNRKLIVLK